MDLGSHVESLSRALAVASAGRQEGREAVTDSFVAPFEAAIRLAMLNLLSAAADEITDALAPGSVDVRLRGGNPDFLVTAPEYHPPAEVEPEPEPAPPPTPSTAEDGATSRISLRLPERLKSRVDEVADHEGLSVNAWLGRVVAAAVEAEERKRKSSRQKLQVDQGHKGWSR